MEITKNPPYTSEYTEIFSVTDLRKSFMQQDKIAVSFLARFLEGAGDRLETILTLQQSEDWEAARREAHSMKGISLTLGGKELGKAAERLEFAYKDINHSEMEAAFIPFREAFSRYKLEVEVFIQSFTDADAGQNPKEFKP